jgi:hypothetical protein
MLKGGQLMVVRNFNLILIIIVSSCAVANDSDAIKINNQLSACISVANKTIIKEGVISVFSFDLEVKRPIAECGCKSALGSYAVYSSTKDYTSYIIGGKVGFMTSARKYLPLSVEGNLINKRELIIEFSCAQPD